jgi:hypothetical protein
VILVDFVLNENVIVSCGNGECRIERFARPNVNHFQQIADHDFAVSSLSRTSDSLDRIDDRSDLLG